MTLRPAIVSFDVLKDQYTRDPYFGPIWESCVQQGTDHSASYVLQDGFLFNGTRFCVPEGSLRESHP